MGPISYMVTAYCAGHTLSQWFAQQGRGIQPTLAAQIVARLADAVQHAHSRHVIHRDLKPGNILLDLERDPPASSADVVGSLRITDFGLAKLNLDDSNLSRSDALIGTPAYMSPEQAAGKVNQIGATADIYALGAILYELLVGTPPHRKESYVATLRSIERDQPPPPRRLNSAVPADLEAICLKCLEKEPEARYASAYELEQDLQRFLARQPVLRGASVRLRDLSAGPNETLDWPQRVRSRSLRCRSAAGWQCGNGFGQNAV